MTRILAKGESGEYNLIIDFRRLSHLYIFLTLVECPLCAKSMPGAGLPDDSATVAAREHCDSASGTSLNGFLWLGCMQTWSVNLTSLRDSG